MIMGFMVLVDNLAFAHPGRTDSSGCHTCRTNCPSWGLSYGEYHCHRAKALPQPLEPIKSNLGSPGTTEPAPEYKTPVQSNSYTLNKEYNSEESGNDYSWLWIVGAGIVGYWIYKSTKK